MNNLKFSASELLRMKLKELLLLEEIIAAVSLSDVRDIKMSQLNKKEREILKEVINIVNGLRSYGDYLAGLWDEYIEIKRK